MKFTGEVFDSPGRAILRLHDVVRWREWLKAHVGQLVQLEVVDADEWASTAQHRFWRGVIVPFYRDRWREERGDALPMANALVHDALVRAFSDEWVETPVGVARKSTAYMTKAEFQRMTSRAKKHAFDVYGAVLDSRAEQESEEP